MSSGSAQQPARHNSCNDDHRQQKLPARVREPEAPPLFDHPGWVRQDFSAVALVIRWAEVSGAVGRHVWIPGRLLAWSGANLEAELRSDRSGRVEVASLARKVPR